MSRIKNAFGKKAFIAFITCGDPDLETTRECVLEMVKNGADLKESQTTGTSQIRYKISILTENLFVCLCITDHLGLDFFADLPSVFARSLAACLSAEITFASSSFFRCSSSIEAFGNETP